MSAMLLEKNSEKSSTKNIKHINMRYYIIKDQVEPGEVITDHFTTTEMSENHLMKPLHGALFRKFRTEIMNIPDDMDMGDTGMDGSGIKRELCGNYITRPILDAHRSVLGMMRMWEGEMELIMDPMDTFLGYVHIRRIV